MHRILVILMFWSCLMAQADEQWYDPPRVLRPAYHQIDSLPDALSSLRAHVRVAPESSRPTSFALLWQWQSDSNCMRAIVRFPSSRGRDDIYGGKAKLSVDKITNGDAEALCQCDVDLTKYLSLKLIYDGLKTARLYAGSEQQQLVCHIDFSNPSGKVFMACNDNILCQRYSFDYQAPANTATTPFANLEQLHEYLSASTDSIEGLWRYLDRDINEKSASLGGKYTIATVRNSDNGYDILFIDNATINSEHWEPLQLKGTLKETIFNNNFDLIWHDAHGIALNDDNNAQFSDDLSILTMRFPVYKSQLRFSRILSF